MSCSSSQAIGYFVSLETDAFNPPVGYVISKDTSDVIIFPFRTEENRLLRNAVSIPFGALQGPFYSSVACLLVLITHRKKLQLCSQYSGSADPIERRMLRPYLYRDVVEEMGRRLPDLEEALACQKRCRNNGNGCQKDAEIMEMAAKKMLK